MVPGLAPRRPRDERFGAGNLNDHVQRAPLPHGARDERFGTILGTRAPLGRPLPTAQNAQRPTRRPTQGALSALPRRCLWAASTAQTRCGSRRAADQAARAARPTRGPTSYPHHPANGMGRSRRSAQTATRAAEGCPRARKGSHPVLSGGPRQLPLPRRPGTGAAPSALAPSCLAATRACSAIEPGGGQARPYRGVLGALGAALRFRSDEFLNQGHTSPAATPGSTGACDGTHRGATGSCTSTNLPIRDAMTMTDEHGVPAKTRASSNPKADYEEGTLMKLTFKYKPYQAGILTKVGGVAGQDFQFHRGANPPPGTRRPLAALARFCPKSIFLRARQLARSRAPEQ